MRVLQRCSCNALIFFSMKHEFKKLFFLVRDLKVLRGPWRTWTFTDQYICDFTTLFYVILRHEASGRFIKIIKTENIKCDLCVIIITYHVASSASRQDESNPALWLATRVGKMELSCPLRTTRCVLQENFPQKPYNKSFTDQACLIKMAGYWPRSFFVSLWTSTPSQSVNTQKRTWPVSSHLDPTLGQ